MDTGVFFQVPVNYFAVLLCGVSAMVLGFLWYGPLFGKPWMKLMGKKATDLMMPKEEMPKTYGLMFVASLIMAYALAHFVWYAAPGSLTPFIAVKTALWSWVGMVFPYALSRYLFTPEKKSPGLLAIDSTYYLASLVVMSIILWFFTTV